MQCSFGLASGRAHRVVAVALFTLMLVPGIAARAQTPGDQAGVFAFGSVNYLFRICSTCPSPPVSWTPGPMAVSAASGRQSSVALVFAAKVKGVSLRVR